MTAPASVRLALRTRFMPCNLTEPDETAMRAALSKPKQPHGQLSSSLQDEAPTMGKWPQRHPRSCGVACRASAGYRFPSSGCGGWVPGWPSPPSSSRSPIPSSAGVGHRSGQLGTAPSWLQGLYGSGFDGESYFRFLFLAFAGYLILLWTAASLPARLSWALIAGVTVAFTLAPPLLSQGCLRGHIAYARLGVVHGLDPYAATPAAAPSDPVFAYVGWPHTASVDGPLFTLLTYPLALLSVPFALWTLKGSCRYCGHGTRVAGRPAGQPPGPRSEEGSGLRGAEPARLRARRRRRPQRRIDDAADDARRGGGAARAEPRERGGNGGRSRHEGLGGARRPICLDRGCQPPPAGGRGRPDNAGDRRGGGRCLRLAGSRIARSSGARSVRWPPATASPPRSPASRGSTAEL